MFYSPTKEFVRFSSYRTQEIKALKDRIKKERVSQEQIDVTQLRLLKLRKQYEELNQEKYSEVKEVFVNSQNAVSQLVKEKNLCLKEDLAVRQQLEQSQKKRAGLQERGSELEDQLRAQASKKEGQVARKAALEENILSLEEQYQQICSQLAKGEAWRKQNTQAARQLSQNKQKYRENWQNSQKEKEVLLQKIKQEEEAISSLKMKSESCEREVWNQRNLIENSRLTQELSKQRISGFRLAKTNANDDEWMVEEQNQLLKNLQNMLRSVNEEAQRVEQEEWNYEKKIKDILEKVNLEEEKNGKLQEKVAVSKTNLKVLHQKNEALRAKMNSIFRNDTQLVSMICSKKTYPHVKNETCEVVKKSAIQPIEIKDSKENVSNLLKKVDKIQKVEPKLFGEVNRVL